MTKTNENNLPNIAGEILRLESVAGIQGWSALDEKQWLELVSHFLSILQPVKDRRKSLRIPMSQTFTLKNSNINISAQCEDVSHRGMSLCVAQHCNLKVGDFVNVETNCPTMGKFSRMQIKVRCVVKWISLGLNDETKLSIGLQFAAFEKGGTAMDVETKQAFSTHVYYPAYVWFLMSMTNNSQNC